MPLAVCLYSALEEVLLFYVLDKNRIIKKIVRGYGKGSTDKEIREALSDLI